VHNEHEHDMYRNQVGKDISLTCGGTARIGLLSHFFTEKVWSSVNCIIKRYKIPIWG